MSILITGGAGFVGSNFVHVWLATSAERVINLDKLTYAGNPANLSAFAGEPRYQLVQGDIGDRELVRALLLEHRPRAVINFAAESHVDRSIHGPDDFIRTNVVGTLGLLESVRGYWLSLPDTSTEPSERPSKSAFRFLHVSTDEVYGSLDAQAPPFVESNRYAPNSPYAASKAASDHLVRAWHHTYGLPVLTTNCSNNYGRYQFPEKLIPLTILNALSGRALPIYGDGLQVRDWLYVDDHCRAIMRVLEGGEIGDTYNIGGGNEKSNLEVVHAICRILDEWRPRSGGGHYVDQIAFVKDRPGHDRRYAIDARKIASRLGWKPRETFDSGLVKTVLWYLDNSAWVADVVDGRYRLWLERQYG